jgi:transposase
MAEATNIHVGLDVHKDSITVAAAEPGREAARVVGKLVHDVNKLVKMLDKVGAPQHLHVVYEAGPTGYGLLRALRARGYCCDVIAPSQMPKRPAASRVKTDGRDSIALAECSRAGQLRAVWVPEPADEAIRDLTRAREDGINSRTKARQQLKSFLLRHEVRYAGKTSWNKMHYRWLCELNFGATAAQMAFTEYLLALQAADDRVQRLSQALQDSIRGWRFEPVVAALQALRGIELVSAVGLVAEIGDLSRFEHPRQLMGYLGLVPSEHSSGERVRRGSITKTGNAHARRLLTEAAWNYRFSARISRRAQLRQEGLSEQIRAMGWKAQLRLTKRFAALKGRGVQINKVCVAVARELTGFVWAVGTLALQQAAAQRSS